MKQAANDPVVRYGALGLVGAAFLGFLAVAIHGYWITPSYILPPFVTGIIASIMGVLLGLLGAHYGASTTASGVSQGAGLTAEALSTNGHSPAATVDQPIR